ncbi:hypothetical protein [Microvirga sesbaniae]|uniref:hypothetical protein n=1 Tax=Microvirga sesbaniae TaxID=681392 RepID=UPI0021CA28C2|nr:hypothetical protein [Microvirga sp. HBU67692]
MAESASTRPASVKVTSPIVDLPGRPMTEGKPMSPSSQWTLFLARPGRDRQSAIRDPQGEPQLIFGEDDGTRINDRLARYLVESLNVGLNPEDPNPDEGWFLDSHQRWQ